MSLRHAKPVCAAGDALVAAGFGAGRVSDRPDWLCELVSEASATMDTVKKLRRYHQANVPHWLVDPAKKTLTVYRHEREGYLTVLAAEAGEVVHAEPFEAIELRVGAVFGEEGD